MIARKGDIRDWHFAHKKKECGYDNYLHSLAERRICEWFNDKENKSILLKLRPANKCSSYEECKWFEILQCEEIGEIKEINLKEYFDSCEVEKDFKKGNDLYDNITDDKSIKRILNAWIFIFGIPEKVITNRDYSWYKE